ncbi:MAG: class C beta-lactamase [Acidobacteria bacterium OLB17]|nr:MAG: class C beta-lactamase [Acidobacteria bacterium OLB17]MCZ2389905.1 beta-lactamase family protein [Acidobacteriota bacterium]
MAYFGDKEINELLLGRISAGDFPSAVYLVGRGRDVCFSNSLGLAVVVPEEMTAASDTIYDLASLTKVLVTTLLAAVLVDRGQLQLDTPLCEILPVNSSSTNGRTTILELATHTSGLPAWKPLYLIADSREDVLARILAMEPERGQGVVYSDLNFILLASVIEELTGNRIDEAAADLVFRPLGLKDTCFCPSPELRRRIAASEEGNRFERETCHNEGYLEGEAALERADRWLRKALIWGEVHDGNAYFMSGVAGHAGLFSTAGDVFVLARQFLPDISSLLGPEACKLFSHNFTPQGAEDRSFGFQLASTKDSTAGSCLSPQSFGHLGFTGTSLWIDPARQATFILLTNRTHDHELPLVNINSVRRKFHDLACAAIERNS